MDNKNYRSPLKEQLRRRFDEVAQEFPSGSMKAYPAFILDLLSLFWRLVSARLYLKRAAHLGSWVTTRGRPKIRIRGRVWIGDRVAIWSIFEQTKLFVHRQGVLTIGSGSRLNGVHISVKHAVTIGQRVRIGPYGLIMDSDFHDVKDRTKRGKAETIDIHDDVWIASRVIILKGVQIGEGSMVAAGAVVTNNVPPHVMVAGVPARVVRRIDETDQALIQDDACANAQQMVEL